MAAFDQLESLFESTGRCVSPLAAVSELSEAAIQFNGRARGEVLEGYLNTIVSVKRKDVAEAIEDFIARLEFVEEVAPQAAAYSTGRI